MSLQYSEGVLSVNPTNRSIQECRIAIFNGYSEFKSFHQINQTPHYPARGTRRKIKVFSSRSRKNMLKKLFCLSEYPSLFVTLTYPKLYPADSYEWKRHLDNFFRSLRRDFPNSWFFWKLEPQKRGAPHFHLFGELESKINISILRKYISELWYRICGTGDIKHLKAGTQADYINDSVGKMRAYVCKYIGKTEGNVNYPEWALPGRFWGIHGRTNLPPALASVINLSHKDFTILRRFVRRWLKRLSPSSRQYASRLHSIPSFHLLAPSDVISRLVEFVSGLTLPPPAPFKETNERKYPRPIYC
jgi:hypothetical protein